MPDRIVKTTLLIDEHGAVKAVHGVGYEASKTETHLGKLDKSAKGLGKTFSGLKGLLAGGIGAIGLGGLAFGLSDVVSKTKEVAAETEKFSSVTGIGATTSLRYTQALKARGLSGETVNKAFGFLAKNLKTAELQEGKYALSQTKAAAKGVLTTSVIGRQAAALKELTGLTAEQYKALGSEEVKLKTVTQAFENLADGEKKTRLEKELFGRGGQALSIVLDKNNLSLNNQIKLVEKFYPTLKGGSKGLQELNERSSESKMAWEGFQFTLGTGVLPILNKAMGAFANVVAEAQKGKGPLHEIETVFEGIAHFAGGAIGVAKELFKIFGVKLPAGTLGAVLAAVGIHSIKHPIKSAKAVPNLIKKGLKFSEGHPEAAPGVLGGLALGVGAYDVGKTLSGGDPFGGPRDYSMPRALVRENREVAATHARHEQTPGEHVEQVVLRAIQQQAPQHQKVELHVDGKKLGEALLVNVGARRMFAEAAAVYAQQMAARR